MKYAHGFLMSCACFGLGVVELTAEEGGKLQAIEQSVEKKAAKKKKPSHHHSIGHHHHGHTVGEVVAEAMVYAVLDGLTLQQRPFTSYPYRIDAVTFREDEWYSNEDFQSVANPMNVRVWLDYGSADEDINRLGAGVLVAFQNGFEIEWEYNSFSEQRSKVDARLDFSSFNLLYSVSFDEVEPYIGLGVLSMVGEEVSDIGGQFTAGIRVFPQKPLVTEFQFRKAAFVPAEDEVGDRVDITRVRATVGGIWNHIEGYLGYDYLEVGSIDLSGPLVGLRAWF